MLMNVLLVSGRKLINFAQLNEILRLLSSTHLAAMASMSMVFEISFSQDININVDYSSFADSLVICR